MSIVAPPSPALVQLLAQAANAPTVQIVQPPPAIAALPTGTVIEAVVLPRLSAPPTPAAAQTPNAPPAPAPTVTPNLALKTGAGVVTARAPIQFPEGTRVDLEVVRTANNKVATRLISVNGMPVQGVKPLPVQNAASIVQNPTLNAQLQPRSVQNPSLRTQILPIGQAWTPPGPAPLTALGPISAFVILGAGAQIGTQPGIQAGAQAGAPPAPAAAGPLGRAAAQPSLQATTFQLSTGGDLTVRLINVQVPGVQAAQTAPPTPPPIPAPAPGPLGQPIAQPNLAGPAPAQTPAAAPQAPSQPAPRLTLASASRLPPATPAPGPLGQPIAQPNLAGPALVQTPTPAAAPQAPSQPPPRLVLANAGGLPPAAPTPPQTVQPAPVLTTLTGTVTSLSLAGAPIVQIDTPQVQGQIQLNVRANAPVGTSVTFEVTAQAPPQTSATSTAPSPTTALPLSGPVGAITGWPTLVESLTILQRTDPQAAAQLAQSIPDGGPRTVVAVMAFAQALRTGDPRQWPGDANLRAIERAGPRGAHLAAQLSGEVSEMASRSRDTGSEWRSLPIPWNAEGRIERVALVTRREEPQDEDSEKKDGGKGTRFLINLDLSKLGSLQLDGMFRKEMRGFDLMIRTKETLPDHMRRDLTGMFASSNAAMGLKGGLTFQVVKNLPDPITEAVPAAQGKSGLWA